MIEGIPTFFVGVIAGNINQKCSLAVMKIEELEYGLRYSNATMSTK